MEIEARQYNKAIASCNHGLAHVTGPIGSKWLLQIKAVSRVITMAKCSNLPVASFVQIELGPHNVC